MHALVLLAALTNHIAFDAAQNGSLWTIVPQVTLSEDCECQIQLEAIRKSASGNSNTTQRSRALIKSHQPYTVSRIQINAEPGDELTITVSVSDGNMIHLTKQWSSPGVL